MFSARKEDAKVIRRGRCEVGREVGCEVGREVGAGQGKKDGGRACLEKLV